MILRSHILYGKAGIHNKWFPFSVQQKNALNKPFCNFTIIRKNYSKILSEFINSLFSRYRDTCNKYKQKRMQSSQITPFEIS